MAGRGASRQELIRRQRSSGFIGRQGQIAAFKDSLKQPPEETTQFLFHIRGPAGVGKSTLVRRLETTAREAQAITAYVDESVADVVEAMEAISAQFAQQGAALKGFDKVLANYRQRRHEVDAGAGADPGAGEASGEGPIPSPSAVVASQLGLVGLGMIPGVGAFTGAVDPNQVAAGADRVKALLSVRLRSHDDVQLVLSPLQTLVPVFLQELAEVARRKPWLVLFFDTYERTGPLLDVWLRDILLSDRYGELPANVLVVLAGQSRLAARCWEDWLDLVTDWPLDVFTDAEARRLLAAKGVTDERIVEVILQLSERLPVLVSTLAEARPSSVEEIGDPSGTAVERFLKWETDPARRAAALVCSLPQELDEDIYRAAVDEDAAELFGWLRSLPFVTDHAGHSRYHDVVRNAMLRLQRQRSPARWNQQHSRLADAFQRRRNGLEEGTAPAEGWWEDEHWRGYRLHETYHRLCAAPRAALPQALRELLDAYDHSTNTLRRWAQVLVRAGSDADAPAVGAWGHQLLTAVEEEPQPGVAAMTALLTHGGLDAPGRSLAYTLRGRDQRNAAHHEQALADYTQAIALVPEAERAYFGRGTTFHAMERYEEALADLTRAIEIDPTEASTFVSRGDAHRFVGRYDEALADLTRAIDIDPANVWAFISRGDAYRFVGRYDEALADYTSAIEIDPTNNFALAIRGVTYQDMGRNDEAIAHLTRAIEISPTSVFAVTSRGRCYEQVSRYDEAIADYTRAIEINPNYSYAFTSRGRCYEEVGRLDKALADYTRAIEINPSYSYAVTSRGRCHQDMGRLDEALADFTRAIEIDPTDAWVATSRGRCHQDMGRNDEALADFTSAIEIDPTSAFVLTKRGEIHRLTGRYDDALADYTRAVEIDPTDAFTLASRGRCHQDTGRNDEALADYTRSIEINAGSTWALTNRGQLHRLAERYEEAVADLTRATEVSPDNAWAHYEKGVALRALRHPDGERHLARVVDLLAPHEDGSNPLSIADKGNLFLAHCAMPRWEEAGRYFTDFLASSPGRGQLSELLSALRSLVRAIPSTTEHILPFCRRLEEGLTAGPPTAP